MSLAVRSLDQVSALQLLSAQMHCDGSAAALRTALVAEHIRTLVSAPFAALPPQPPIHTARLMGALSRNLRFLAARTDDIDDLQSAFAFAREQLTLSGDIAHVGNGYWIPCPIRAVRIGADDVYLFGGAPITSLARHLRWPVAAIGPSRHVRTAESVAWPVLTLAQWLEYDEPLPSWTEHILTRAGKELAQQADIEDDGLEIYAPDVFRVLQRPGFWASAREFRESAPTLRLFRPKTTPQWVFDRPDYLGIFRQGPHGAQLVRAVRIAHDTARRLQFGLDLVYQTPRTLVLRRIDDSYRLDIKFPPFPEPEGRVLGLGWREPGAVDALFFAPAVLPVLRGVTELLGMRLYHT